MTAAAANEMPVVKSKQDTGLGPCILYCGSKYLLLKTKFRNYEKKDS
jgi:hypothetical protein